MYARILVPIDGSACSDQGAKEAVALAKGLGSAVVFLFVMDTLSTRKEGVVNMSEALEALTAQGRVLLDSARRIAASAASARPGSSSRGRRSTRSHGARRISISSSWAATVEESSGDSRSARWTQDVMQRIRFPC